MVFNGGPLVIGRLDRHYALRALTNGEASRCHSIAFVTDLIYGFLAAAMV